MQENILPVTNLLVDIHVHVNSHTFKPVDVYIMT